MAAVEAEKKVVGEENKVEEKGGEILFCGGTCWDIIGRKKGAQEGNLVSPTRLRPLIGVDIRFVTSGCASCHCVALDVEGRCYTWGRNEVVLYAQKGQLGHGDKIQRDRPTIVSELSKYKVVRAGAGRSHTVVVSDDGQSLAFGWNKHGQLGSGSVKNETESLPVRCLVSDVKTTACGADFTVWLSSVEGASILYGLPQYGQLGHGTDNEYNTKDSSVRLAYEAQPRPRAIASLSAETVVKVACGTNHTVAVDSNGYVYTWGFGGYGRLGHREQKDEWIPRRVEVFQKHNVLPPNAVISAGAVNSACTAGGGQLYMWGKIKNTGDDWMYPKPLMDLSGWNIRCMDSGSMHHFVGADNSCISWGHAQYGELGYGPSGQKSSAVPKKVEILEGTHVIGVACGMAHSMVIIDRTNFGDRLDQFDVYDGKASGGESKDIQGMSRPAEWAKSGNFFFMLLNKVSEEPESKTPVVKQNTKKSSGKVDQKSKKRKKSKGRSESEDEENTDDESDNSDEQANGEMEHNSGGKASGRGKLKGANKSAADGKGTGRGRGRPPTAKKSANSSQEKTSKRGRPRKS